MRHILTADQFDLDLTTKLFAEADKAYETLTKGGTGAAVDPKLAGRIMYRLFYEASTRTYESFGFAATHLGMSVLGTQSVQFSSVSKGETLEDTIRMISGYDPSLIVLRSATAGDALRAAEISSVPVVNAGDGKGEHPTQSLLDLYTMHRELGRTENLHIVLGGDMANGRTARSLVKILSKYPGNRFTFVAPPTFEMGEDILAELDAKHIPCEQTTDVMEALKTADVAYWTRIQKERVSAEQTAYLEANPSAGETFSIGKAQISVMPEHARLMHPLPRVGEIKTEVDSDPRAIYFTQARYGMFVRMALIKYVLEEI